MHGLRDNICLPALRRNRAGSLLHSFPLPGTDPRVRCDPRLPLAHARPAPSTAAAELGLRAALSPSAEDFCFLQERGDGAELCLQH